ncbi:MAG: exosortase/archaeosortase family protein, partial [Chthoniobacteraceae bacterium]
SNPQWTPVGWSLAIEVVGLTLLAIVYAAGWPSLRHFAFPVCFFLVAVAWPLQWEMPLTQNLMQMLAKLAVEFLGWFGVAASSQGNLIQLDAGLVGVDEACSGVRSLHSMLMASLFLGEMQRLPIVGRVTLVVAGLAIAIFFNIVRALILVVVVLRSGLAGLASWHDPAGYSIFAISLAVLLVLVRLFSESRPVAEPPPVVGRWRPLPRFVLLSLGVWLLFTEASTEAWYRRHETPGARPFVWQVLWPDKLPSFTERPITSRVAAQLAYSEGRAGSWQEDDGSRWLMFAFRWNPGRTSTMAARVHRPEVCLPGGGQKMVAELAPVLIPIGDMQVPFRIYHFDDRGQSLFVFFCLWENGNRDLAASGLRQEYGRVSFLERVRSGQRNLGQQSAEIIVSGLDSADAAREAFQRKASALLGPGS